MIFKLDTLIRILFLSVGGIIFRHMFALNSKKKQAYLSTNTEIRKKRVMTTAKKEVVAEEEEFDSLQIQEEERMQILTTHY